ncbi:MAG: hypothetical protein IKP21_08895, partial [Bacteroidales bacterium]|nr:hypothetical protein [Bacteroidales bacterium]
QECSFIAVVWKIFFYRRSSWLCYRIISQSGDPFRRYFFSISSVFLQWMTEETLKKYWEMTENQRELSQNLVAFWSDRVAAIAAAGGCFCL